MKCVCSVYRVENIECVKSTASVSLTLKLKPLHGLLPRCQIYVLFKSAEIRFCRSHNFIVWSYSLYTSPLFEITFLTSIGWTAPSPSSSSIRGLARTSSLLWESLYSVHTLLVILARGEYYLVPHFLKDLQAGIRNNWHQLLMECQSLSFPSTASLTISPFICREIESGTCSVGANTRVPNWASFDSGCSSCSCHQFIVRFLLCFTYSVITGPTFSFRCLVAKILSW